MHPAPELRLWSAAAQPPDLKGASEAIARGYPTSGLIDSRAKWVIRLEDHAEYYDRQHPCRGTPCVSCCHLKSWMIGDPTERYSGVRQATVQRRALAGCGSCRGPAIRM